MPPDIEPTAPAAPPSVPSGSVLDDPSSARFQALLRDPRLFIRQLDPFTAAIWTALLKPTSQIVNNARRIRTVEQPAPSDEPGEEQSPDDPLAIVTLGEAIVFSALMGDSKAQAQIADRIEGKVGLRKGDEDPEAAKNRSETLGLMRDIIRTLGDNVRRGDDAKIVDARTVDAPE